ncbi:ATP-binding cassette domain-containing protein [bacterium]|nr:ATP-binding cassette domain-containing protein [bacterium]MBU1883979.1 ATP-binding cassette domain-containing protein [bacterium]
MKKIIEVKDLYTQFGDNVVHAGLNLHVNEGDIYGILGPSGCGKSTVLREMVMLQEFQKGKIEVLGYDVANISYDDAQKLRKSWGVLFQGGALFSSLNLYENIALPLQEYTDLDQKLISEIVSYKIDVVGLKQTDAFLYPSQISGGMRKKASLARALSLDPKLLFLDEPTSGLDPISARDFDRLILKLRDMLGLSIVMVSHDLKSIYDTLDRLAVIDDKVVVAEGKMNDVISMDIPFIQTFFKADI